MNATAKRISDNLDSVVRRMAAACERASRDPADVTLVAVTKYAAPEWVRELVALGVTELGESRPQQLLQRAEWFPPAAVRWHLVGHLQRNKARRVLPVATLIHSVDSLRLMQTLDRLAGETGIAPRVLLEVNVSGEEAKHGFEPSRLEAEFDAVLACRRVRVEGLMTMAPYSDEPEDARPTFRGLRALRERLRESVSDAPPLTELSMGMSGDFEVGVEEGATLVRVGSLLFEGLGGPDRP